jgi:hypothetical protein
VSFTQQQREQIKIMVESGRILEAQRVIIDELISEFGGAAKAAADASIGFTRLQNKIGEVADAFGRGLLPVVQDINSELAEMLDVEKAEKWGNSLRNTIKEVSQAVKESPARGFFGPITPGELREAQRKFAAGIPVKALPPRRRELLGKLTLGLGISKDEPIFLPGPTRQQREARITEFRAEERERGLAAGHAAIALGEKTMAEIVAEEEAEAERMALKDIAASNALIAERQLFGDPFAQRILDKIEVRQARIADLEEDMAQAQKTFTPSFTSLDEAWRMMSTTTVKADDKKIKLLQDQVKEQKELVEVNKAMLAVLEAGPTFQ